MCYFLAAIPAIVGAMSTAAGAAAGATGTFMGLSAGVWGGIGAASAVAGAGLSAASAIQQGNEAKETAKYNAKVEEVKAVDAERRGSMAEATQRQRAQIILGKQRAAQGGSGVLADTGSGSDVLQQTAAFGERDATAMRLNAGREAWGYRSKATLDRYSGEVAQEKGYASGASAFLTGTSSMLAADPWWKTAFKADDNRQRASSFDSWWGG